MDPIVDPTSVSRGRAAHLDATRILDATEACLKEQGYDGTTIRQIAKRLNCAVGSIYRYFTDKRALLDAVTQRRFQPVLAALEEGIDVDASIEQYRSIAAAEPEAYRLMFWLACVGKSTPDGSGAQPGLPAIIDAAIKGWAVKLGDDEAFNRWALLHGKLMVGSGLSATGAEAEAETSASETAGQDAPAGETPSASATPTILVDASGRPRDTSHTP